MKRKMDAIRIQQILSCDSVSAFKKLGLKPDMRNHALAIAALSAVLSSRHPIELLTNNPAKESALRLGGLNVVRRRPLV